MVGRNTSFRRAAVSDGILLPLPSGSHRSLAPLCLGKEGGDSSASCMFGTSSVCSRRTEDCALPTVCGVSSSLPASRAFHPLRMPLHCAHPPPSPSLRRPRSLHILAVLGFAPFPPKVAVGLQSLCHCGLTCIRHLPAQVTGAVFEWDNPRMQTATFPVPRNRRSIHGAAGIWE